MTDIYIKCTEAASEVILQIIYSAATLKNTYQEKFLIVLFGFFRISLQN